MNMMRAGLLLLLAAVVSGCAGDPYLGPTPGTFVTGSDRQPEVVATWAVTEVAVTVPDTLSIATDPDERFPETDLNWWEDPPGDRRAQIADIMREAVAGAVSPLRGTTPVRVEVTVRKFHALTPDALENGTRGWHDVIFDLAVRDAAGTLLAEETAINADIRAYQGEEAKRALARGETQRKVIARRVADVVRAWFGIR